MGAGMSAYCNQKVASTNYESFVIFEALGVSDQINNYTPSNNKKKLYTLIS